MAILKFMKAIYGVFVIAIAIVCCDASIKEKKYGEFTVVSDISKFLATRYDIKLNFSNTGINLGNPYEHLILYYDFNQKHLFVNHDFSQGLLENVFKRAFLQKKALIVVCEKSATIEQREVYYDVYKRYITTAREALDSIARHKYGKGLSEIPYTPKYDLGFDTAPWLFYSRHIGDPGYQNWVQDFALPDECKKRNIPLFLHE
jgi:hypothetical protein